MNYAVITPAWDTEGKFFVIDASNKKDMLISENGTSTYAEALPETEAEIIALFRDYDASKAIQTIGNYTFRAATEDWYLAEAQLI
jgi:hypothetical protein